MIRREATRKLSVWLPAADLVHGLNGAFSGTTQTGLCPRGNASNFRSDDVLCAEQLEHVVVVPSILLSSPPLTGLGCLISADEIECDLA